MYPYIKKQDRRLYDRLNRDIKLNYPDHNEKKPNEVRDAYIKDLMNNQTFEPTHKANYEHAKKPLKKTIKEFSWKHYLLIAFFGLVFGGFTLGTLEFSAKTPSKKKKALSTAMMFLGGLGLGAASAVAFKDSDREYEIDSFYNRLIIRYFDKLKKKDSKTFSDDVLLNCNPEMVRVIRAILMANMSERDTKRIQYVATTTTFANAGSNINELRRLESDIKYAMKILEKSLSENPELDALLKKAYNGYIPELFVINSANQKTK